ncbi:hypothetical protein CGLO_11816 [Colletotrichum gloeosporioides Cg-14]|uniref:Uncharacterized protein n=1 Tax=Colletotrichum gloeosporioides (strain Cg-14) TaxID=1237896 RepID=T0LKX1_COLGC|nr:hypothetical protein CGLO_11816 [Colletotrichum gloeosporioides Cg-14]
MESNKSLARERRREERRKQRAYDRELEERLLQENTAAEATMSLVPTTSESGTSAQHRPEGARSDGGETITVALRPNVDSGSSQNKFVRWAQDDEVIEIPRLTYGDESDAAVSREITTQANTVATTAASMDDNALSEHHAAPRPSNNLSYVDGLFINAGAHVESLTWTKTETNNHNHYYAHPQAQQQQQQPTIEAAPKQDGTRQGLVSRILQSPHFYKWLMYAILAVVVILVVCMTVSWACQLVIEAILLPFLLVQLVSTGVMNVYHGTLGRIFSSTAPDTQTPAPVEDNTAGGLYQTAAIVISPLIPYLSRLAGVTGQADLVTRETQSLLLMMPPSDGGVPAAEQISAVLEHLQTVQDETNVEWEHHLRDDLRATRRATAELRRLQPDAERKVASWWWWIFCEAPPPALVPARWCAGLPSRVVAVLDKAVDVAQGARKIREVHIKDGRILVSAHDVKEEVCRLHDQDVLGGMVKEVARQISAQAKDGGSDVPDGVVKEEEDKVNEGIAATATTIATTESLRRAETRLGDQRSGLRVNCMAAAHVEAGVGIVRDRLVAQVDALEEISDSFMWLRQSVVDQDKSVPDAIEKGIELLATLEAELMRCV